MNRTVQYGRETTTGKAGQQEDTVSLLLSGLSAELSLA